MTLSDKMIQTGGSDGFLAHDVKEFIKDLKEEDKLRKGICIIISYMLDHPNENGIFPTTKCFNELIDFFRNRVDNEAGDKLI